MRISNQPRQSSLFCFEQDVLTVAGARNATGEFFEELTAALVGGVRLVTDHRKDICPDIVSPDGRYFESKSVGKTNASIVYESRLIKDHEFTQLGNSLTYVIWKHNARVHDGMAREELNEYLVATLQYAMLVPFETYRQISLTGPLMLLNAKNTNRGYGSYGYTKGFRTRLSKFLSTTSCKGPAEIIVGHRRITVPAVFA